MRPRDFKLATKQIVGFGVILTILAAVNLFSLKNLGQLKDEIDEVSTNWFPRAIALSEIKLSTTDLRLNQLRHAFFSDKEKKQEQADMMIALVDKINGHLDTYYALRKESEEAGLYSEEEKKLFESFEEQWESYQDLFFEIFKLSSENKSEEAAALLSGDARVVYQAFREKLDQLVRTNQADSFAAAERATKTFRSTRAITTTLVVGTVIFSILLAGGLVRIITVPIRNLEEAAGRIAAGDLDVKLEILSKDEIGNLSKSFNTMTTSLKEAKEQTERQASELLAKNEELEEKSRSLERQKSEIEQKNSDLQSALVRLKETQQELLTKGKMAALGDLVAGVTHEINNPIGAVNSANDVARRCVNRIEKHLERQQTIEALRGDWDFIKSLKILRENINVTLRAGERIATMVGTLKNFARVDESTFQQVDIHEGIDSSLVLLGGELKNRVAVVRSYAEIPRIGCYPGQLNQVFINLLKNASNAIEKKGTITIQTQKENGNVVIRISDDGRGIPKEKIERIWDIGFSREGSRVKMGSGLSASLNIVQNHKGKIEVDSEVGRGTTFSVTLPIK